MDWKTREHGVFLGQPPFTLGWDVYGTARAVKHDFLRGLGVDEPIDYTTTDFTEVAHDVDVVFDLIGGENAVRSVDVLKPGGTVFAVPGGVSEELVAKAHEIGAANRLTGKLVLDVAGR